MLRKSGHCYPPPLPVTAGAGRYRLLPGGSKRNFVKPFHRDAPPYMRVRPPLVLVCIMMDERNPHALPKWLVWKNCCSLARGHNLSSLSVLFPDFILKSALTAKNMSGRPPCFFLARIACSTMYDVAFVSGLSCFQVIGARIIPLSLSLLSCGLRHEWTVGGFLAAVLGLPRFVENMVEAFYRALADCQIS